MQLKTSATKFYRFERKGKQYLILNFDLPLNNLFIYQARESSLVPRGFFDSSVSAESVIYEAFFYWVYRVVLLFVHFLEERKYVEKLGRMKNGYVSTFLCLHANNAEKPHLLLPSQQRLYKLCFLQKLGCQKPCWDQARLSSLVNKQVVPQ